MTFRGNASLFLIVILTPMVLFAEQTSPDPKWFACSKADTCSISRDPCGNPVAISSDHYQAYVDWSKATFWHCMCASFPLMRDRQDTPEEAARWNSTLSNLKKSLECRESKCFLEVGGFSFCSGKTRGITNRLNWAQQAGPIHLHRYAARSS